LGSLVPSSSRGGRVTSPEVFTHLTCNLHSGTTILGRYELPSLACQERAGLTSHLPRTSTHARPDSSSMQRVGWDLADVGGWRLRERCGALLPL